MNPELLESLPLRDIHLPPAPGFWPPAPGWWLLALLMLLFIALAAVVIARRLRRHRRKKQLMALVRSLTQKPGDRPVEKLAQLSMLLRRIALSRYPRSQVASLTGSDWLRFLDSTGGNGGFAEGPGQLLADGPYRRELDDSSQLAAVAELALRWAATNTEGSRGT